MRQTELIKTMSVKEIMDWMAYDISCDDKFRENYSREREIERQQALDAEAQAELMRQLFRGLNGTR